MTEFQRRVAQAFDGNHGVWFHPFEDKIAVWYGEASVRVFDPTTFEEVNTHTIGIAYREDVEYDTVESAVDVILSELGFYRNKERKQFDVDGFDSDDIDVPEEGSA